MVGDITYIPTWEGWLYLATVHRLPHESGHRLGDRRQLQDPADQRGDQNGRPQPRPAAGAIFHSDRGSNYTSAEFAGVLNGLGIRQSVGRTGICYDNAMAESFFAALKTERVHRTQYPDPRTRPPGYCPLHRTPLQYQQTPLGTRLQDPARSPTSTATGRPQHETRC